MCSLFLLPTHRGGGLPTFHLSPVCAGKPSLHDWSRSSELLQGRKGSLHWRDKVADLQNLQYVDTDVEGLVDVATCSDVTADAQGTLPNEQSQEPIFKCPRTGG